MRRCTCALIWEIVFLSYILTLTSIIFIIVVRFGIIIRRIQVSDFKHPLWSSQSLCKLPQAPSFAGVQLFSIPGNRLLIVQRERRIPVRFCVYTPEKKEFQELEKPSKNPHQEIVLSKEHVLFVRYLPDTATHNAELVLWNPITGAKKTMLDKIPFGYRLHGDIVANKLHLIATSSDEGCDAGFDWKYSSALAAILDIDDMFFDTPFHEIEDLDVAQIQMLDANLCFVTAYSRRGSSYYHLRDMRIIGPQKKGVQSLYAPSGYKLASPGRDATGQLLFFGESYHGNENALFLLEKGSFEFTIVRHWKNWNAYYPSAIEKKEADFIFCSKRGGPYTLVLQYHPNKCEVSVAVLKDFSSVGDMVMGEDGLLYVYALAHATDAKWRFYCIEMDDENYIDISSSSET